MNNYEEIKMQWTVGDIQKYPCLFAFVKSKMEETI